MEKLILVCRLVHLTAQVLRGGSQVGCDGVHFCLVLLYFLGEVAVVVHQLGQVSSHFTQALQKLLLLAAVVPPPFKH